MRYIAADGGMFIDTKTGKLVTVEEMERGIEDVYKDKSASAENADTDQTTLPRQAQE